MGWVRSSNNRDYSDRDDLFAQMNERDKRAQEYLDAAKEHTDLAASERLAKVELLRKTGLAAFVNKRCEEYGFKFEKNGAFAISNEGNLYLTIGYFILSAKGNSYPENINKMTVLIEILGKIGIPNDHIKKWVYHAHPADEKGKPKIKGPALPAENVYIPVDESVITGLIEKAVGDRFALIQQRFDSVEGKTQEELHDELINISELITRETGREVADEHPEKEMKFSDKVIAGIKDDIRKKVTDEVLGGLVKSAGQDEGQGL